VHGGRDALGADDGDEGGVRCVEDEGDVVALRDGHVQHRQRRVAEGLQHLLADGGQVHEAHPQVLVRLVGGGATAEDGDVVAAGGEPAADLLDGRLEPAVGGGDATGAHHRDPEGAVGLAAVGDAPALRGPHRVVAAADRATDCRVVVMAEFGSLMMSLPAHGVRVCAAAAVRRLGRRCSGIACSVGYRCTATMSRLTLTARRCPPSGADGVDARVARVSVTDLDARSGSCARAASLTW
jgi:hypothetical protein